MRKVAHWLEIRCQVLMLVLVLTASSVALAGEEAVVFTDIAGPESGLVYERVPSPRNVFYDLLKRRSQVDLDGDGQPDMAFLSSEIPSVPMKPRGAPGVAIFDFDGDGDLDIYVTNGPGADNSLFENQFKQTGILQFVEVSSQAGVAARHQDSSGVCFGDIDNDGDPDLFVLGTTGPNLLFVNRGNGTFADMTPASGLGGGNLSATSATMGDVNGDGLLDIVVGNSFNHANQIPIFVEPFELNQHNQLFINQGDNRFLDLSVSSGIQNLDGLPADAAGSATITWAVALVDYDLDGDVDLFTADDQAAIPPDIAGGVNRGYIRIFQNDGLGNFSDVTLAAGTDKVGAWMGLSFGDFNADGEMDVFGSNLGDFFFLSTPRPFIPGLRASRWFFGSADGSFSDPGVGELLTTPFGWGAVAPDYDNDGDTDIIFHGGLDFTPLIDLSNPGAVLRNDGNGHFSRDDLALANSTNHSLRVVNGCAVGDLNEDGFVDVVSVSNEDSPPEALELYPLVDSPFSPAAYFVDMFVPVGVDQFTWSGFQFENGSLAVEINSGDNGNRWAAVDLLGSLDVTRHGVTNRDGIGAVVSFTPKRGPTAMKPVVGGSSHASQNSTTVHFGMGSAKKGVLEVLWPGGARNRLYNVKHGERITFPEIGVSFTSDLPFGVYKKRVKQALRDLRSAGLISPALMGRLLSSAIKAYHDSH